MRVKRPHYKWRSPCGGPPAVSAADEADSQPDERHARPTTTLMAAYARGDAAAFERLYARHQAGAVPLRAAPARHALRRAGRRGVPGHLAARGATRAQRWQPQGASFRTWLFTLAHHRAIDIWRRSGREVSLERTKTTTASPGEPDAGAAWQHWPAPATATRDDQAFWRRAGERLLDCLDELPLAQRSAFLLHHDDGAAARRGGARARKSASRPRRRGCAMR